MAKRNGDILVTIGSELNPSFTKTITKAQGTLGRLFSDLYHDAKAVKKLDKDYEKFGQDINKTNKKITKSKSKQSTYASQLSALPRMTELKNNMTSASSEVKAQQRAINKKEKSGDRRGIKGMENALTKLKAKLDAATKAYNDFLNENNMSGRETASSLVKKINAENESIEKQEIKIKELKDKQKELKQQQEEMTKNLWFVTSEDALNSLNKGISKLTTSFKKLGSTVLKIMGRMSGLWSKTTSDAISLSKAVSLVVQYGFGFRSLYYLVRRFRTGIAEGFEYLGGVIKSSKKEINGFSEEIGKYLDQLKEAVYFLKSATASALQPLMNVVMPALAKIVELASRASVAIATFFATLTGQTYIYKANKNLEAYANALDQATGSAKALENQLAGFDEMNVLSGNNTSGSSGSQLDTSTWFETEQVEPSDFALMLQNAIDKADFTAIGEHLGNKLKTMLDNINWNFVMEKVENIAKDISTFINGFVSVDNLGATIGKTIANTINGISDFIVTYVQKLDWKKLGQFITDGINGLITNLKTIDLGKSIGLQAKKILDLFTDILRNLKTKDLVRGISDFIEGLNIRDLISSIKKLATQIIKTLGDAISELSKSQPGLLRITEAILASIAVIKTATIANSLIKIFTAGKDNLATLVIRPVLTAAASYIKTAITGSTFYPMIVAACGQLGAMLTPVLPVIIIGGVLAGIATLVKKHIESVNNDLTQAVEGVYDATYKYEELAKEMNKTADETIANGEEEARVTEIYTKKLLDCFDSTGELKEGQEALAQVYLDKLSANGVIAYGTVEELTQAFKDGKISVDEITASTQAYCEQLIQTAHVEAYKSAISSLVEEQIKLEKENDELTRQEELKSVAYDNLVTSLTEYIKAHSQYPDNIAESMAIQRVNEKLSAGSEEYLKYAKSILGEEGAQVIADAISGMSEDEIKSFATIDEALVKNSDALDKNLQDQDYYASQLAKYASDITTTVTENYDTIETDSNTTAKAVNDDWKDTMDSMSANSKTTQQTVDNNMKTMENGVNSSLKNMSSTAETENKKFGNSMAKNSAGSGKVISENITSGLEGANDSTVDAFNSMSSNASEGMKNLNNTIYSGMNDVGRTYTNALSKMVDKYNEYLNKTDQGYGRSMSTSFSFNKVSTSGYSTLALSKKTFSNSAIGRLNSSLPALAQGAVIPPNSEFLAVLGDQKHGTNVEAPLDTIVQAVQQALSTSNIGGDVNVNLVVDGKVLARTVAKYNDKLAFSANGGRLY